MTLGHLCPYGVLCVEESAQAKKRRKLMSHAAPLKGPAPPAAEVMTLWKRMKHLGTLLTTEEVFDGDGTSKRVTRVRRSIRM